MYDQFYWLRKVTLLAFATVFEVIENKEGIYFRVDKYKILMFKLKFETVLKGLLQ